jgi:hypothetical protein
MIEAKTSVELRRSEAHAPDAAIRLDHKS